MGCSNAGFNSQTYGLSPRYQKKLTTDPSGHLSIILSEAKPKPKDRGINTASLGPSPDLPDIPPHQDDISVSVAKCGNHAPGIIICNIWQSASREDFRVKQKSL